METIILSGGDLGGEERDGTNWATGDSRVFNGLIYRRINDSQAVFSGVEQDN